MGRTRQTRASGSAERLSVRRKGRAGVRLALGGAGARPRGAAVHVVAVALAGGRPQDVQPAVGGAALACGGAQVVPCAVERARGEALADERVLAVGLEGRVAA